MARNFKQQLPPVFPLLRELSKSGIVTLVLISVLAGYLCGQPLERPIELDRLTLTLIGILLLASGSSALNQWQERKIDAKMPRTAKRPLPSGKMSPRAALFFVAGTLIPGLILLYRLDLWLFKLGLIAAFSYNVLYTLWWKPRLPYAAIPGAIPGALPALMGFVAAHRKIEEPGGWFLFLLLFFWQMPHFWVLAIRYREDYRKGGIPTLPVAKGAILTVGEVLIWGLAYVGIALLAPLFLPVSKVYLGLAILMSVKMLWELKLWSGDPEAVADPERKTWLRFFLWINLSLIVYLAALVADLWGVYLVPYMS